MPGYDIDTESGMFLRPAGGGARAPAGSASASSFARQEEAAGDSASQSHLISSCSARKTV